MSFLRWLENTFGWVQEADSLFAYPMILTVHTFGLAFLVGISVAISLRILGVGKALPLAPLERFFPLMVFGFWCNVITGALLFAPEATRWAFNPDFLLKMFFVFAGMYLIHLTRVTVFHDEAVLRSGTPTARSKAIAGAQIAVWVMAITTGRLTAYVDGWAKFMKMFEVTAGH
jgi:hypothetical protein